MTTQPAEPRKSLPIFKPSPRVIDEDTKRAYSQIYFRQSFIQDYLLCPYMAMSRWLGSSEEKASFLATYLGTAGHEVIYRIHKERKYDIDQMWLTEAFEQAFHEAIRKEPDKVPTPRPGFETIVDQFQTEIPYYVEILKGYQRHPQNHEFHSIMHEQSFVLSIGNPAAETDPTKAPYLICGTIDQAGYYSDGRFVLRDIKFRDNAFKYSRRELDLNIQMTTYAAALKYGVPSCDECKPRYEQEMVSPVQGTLSQKLTYNGPCAACSAKIGKPDQWPLQVPERCEMIWMFDFEPRTKDEFPQFIQRKDLPKVKNPKTGRMIYREVENPEWAAGAKAGTPKGDCFLRTYRTIAQLQVFLDDILRVCDQIREGIFFRLPSKQCNYCTQYDNCRGAVTAETAIAQQKSAAMYGSSDPFGGI